MSICRYCFAYLMRRGQNLNDLEKPVLMVALPASMGAGPLPELRVSRFVLGVRVLGPEGELGKSILCRA